MFLNRLNNITVSRHQNGAIQQAIYHFLIVILINQVFTLNSFWCEHSNDGCRTLCFRLSVIKLLLAAPPLDTRPCISRFAWPWLRTSSQSYEFTTSAMLTQRSCCLLQRLSAAGPSLGSELAGTMLCGL